jgi:hypothetical protein
MAITTLAGFIDALEALSVTGVNKNFTNGPPRTLSTAQIPALWVELPESDDAILTFQAQGGWPSLRATMVIAAEPVAQSLQEVNFALCVTLLDNLATALRAASPGTFCKSGLKKWEMKQGFREIAGVGYWVITCTVEGAG